MRTAWPRPEVGIGDHEFHPAQAAGGQAAQEPGPERAVLAVPDIHAQNLAVPVGAHSDRDDHGLGHHLVIHAGLAVGRIQEHIRVAGVGQAAAAKRGDLIVEIGADPGDLALGDPRPDPERLDQIIDLAGGHPVQIGLHHHREQGLIHPPAAIEQRGEERPGAQLRDPQRQIPRRRGQRPRSGAVALIGARGAALPGLGTDRGRQLGLDQRLIHRLGRDPDAFTGITGLECVEDFQ